MPALTAISMYFGTGRRRFKIRRMPEWVEAIFERGRVERSIIVCGVMEVAMSRSRLHEMKMLSRVKIFLKS